MSKVRSLTLAEIGLAKKIYKSSMDYAKVKVHNGKYGPFQPNNSGMTPKGEIYVDGAYRADYGSASPYLMAFFIHEMAHVYQYQLNILDPISSAIGAAIKHGFNYDKAYFYELKPDKDLLDYGIEQQAQIIEDYYRVNFLSILPKDQYLQNKLADVKRDGLFAKVLKKFISDPAYAKHIDVCKRRKRGGHVKTICTRVLAK